MRLPRDVSDDELARLLRRRYGYQFVRQRGSHMRMTTTVRGTQRHVSIPRHRYVNIRLLRLILSDVADYIGLTQDEIRRELFGR